MTVYLVGAGPGDPDLITVKGARLVKSADVLIYDRLVHPDLINLAPANAERISVGKEPGQPSTSQEDINALLVHYGLRQDRVVRLKGGDPFMFARGSEEAAALAGAAIDFEIVPGITSALAAPAYAGIPVTQRRDALSVTIVTGHEDPTTGRLVNWDAIARTDGTIVVLMGAARVRQIATRLLSAGKSPQTAAAVVHWGTYPHQQQWRGTLATLGVEPVPNPSVIVIGTVAGVDLSWFTDQPLR